MSEIVLRGTDLRKSYGGVHAIRGLSIALKRGEIRGLIGPNGAGKSTLIDLLTGRAQPSAGTVELEGKDVTRLGPVERMRLGISRSFQRTSIFPALTVTEQMDLATGVGGEEYRAAILQEFFLDSVAGRLASEISYGEQRRLDLALALATRPKVLLLDEPAAGLTIEESRRLMEHLQRISRNWNVTVMLVEHDMEVVFGVCDSLTVIATGEVLAEGSADEIRKNPEVIRSYLGSAA